MTRTPTSPPIRPGWAIPPDLDPSEAHLPRRRWRILYSAKPRTDPVGPRLNRFGTPEDFVRWLATELDANELHAYFRDLEAIAKMSCDLELLRFARKYLHGDLTCALIEG